VFTHAKKGTDQPLEPQLLGKFLHPDISQGSPLRYAIAYVDSALKKPPMEARPARLAETSTLAKMGRYASTVIARPAT
jgi:hypothetical protein